uniref:Uncharacterized protein n=1 Tax=Setaria italica TaxID=4555 RepID=K3ZPN8_SETIT
MEAAVVVASMRQGLPRIDAATGQTVVVRTWPVMIRCLLQEPAAACRAAQLGFHILGLSDVGGTGE